MDDGQNNSNASGGSLAPRRPTQVHRPHASLGGSYPRSAIGGEPSSGGILTPAFLWWTFRRWWRVIVPAGLVLAAAAATAVVLTYKPDYQASALIMIESSAPYIAFSNEATSSGSSRYVETQVELLRSGLVLGPVLSRKAIAMKPGVAEAPDRLAFLQKSLGISQIGGSELYNVSYTSKSPQDSAEIANAVVEEYLKIQSKEEFARFQRVIDLLEEERAKRSVGVERLRARVTELARDVTGRDAFGYDTNLELKGNSSPLSSTYHELTRIEVDRAVLEAQIRSIQESSEAPLQDEKSGLLDLQIDSNPTVVEAQASIDDLTMRAQEFKSKLRPDADLVNNQAYQRLTNEIWQQQEALKEFKTKQREVLLAERTAQRQAERTDSLAKLQQDLELINTRRETLSDKFKKEMEGLKSENTKTVDLEFARAELDREERIFEMIASRKLAMQTESRAPARVALRQSATAPAKPVSPLPYKILFLACAAALVAPYGLAVAREMSVRRISDVEQLSRETSLKIIGEVAHFPIRRAAANTQLLSSKARRQMFLYLDSIDSLRTNIALSNGEKQQQVIVVTSAAAGEGKTCLSTSLAMSIARADKRPTLIIDADLRAPDVATVLSVRAKPGLAELMRDEVLLSEVIQRVGKTNAYVIPAGRLKGNPHHALRDDNLRPLLERLREDFATIIIDTPPVFGGSESLVMAKMADATIVSLLSDVSRSRQLTTVVDRLEHAGANVLGAVLNGKQTGSYANYYGYGSYSGRMEALEE
jgi:capsular exopolysaccharide synthesis family protein